MLVPLRPHPSTINHTPSECSAPALASVDEWLKLIGLEQYRENFHTAGYSSIESVIPMNHEWASHYTTTHYTCNHTPPDKLQNDPKITPMLLFYRDLAKMGISCSAHQRKILSSVEDLLSGMHHRQDTKVPVWSVTRRKKNNASCWSTWIYKRDGIFHITLAL